MSKTTCSKDPSQGHGLQLRNILQAVPNREFTANILPFKEHKITNHRTWGTKFEANRQQKPCVGAVDVKRRYDRGGLVGSYNQLRKDHMGHCSFPSLEYI